MVGTVKLKLCGTNINSLRIFPGTLVRQSYLNLISTLTFTFILYSGKGYNGFGAYSRNYSVDLKQECSQSGKGIQVNPHAIGHIREWILCSVRRSFLILYISFSGQIASSMPDCIKAIKGEGLYKRAGTQTVDHLIHSPTP